MRKTATISLKECYVILQLPRDASLEEVKKAYRKRAFELHPDLNPDDPTASKQFQVLNEAYVALSQILQKEEELRQAKTKTQAAGGYSRSSQAQQDQQKESQKAKEAYKQERAHKTSEGARREEEARRRQEARRAEEERLKREAKEKEEAKKEEARVREDIRKRTEESRQRAASAAYAKEDVLRDLLHDPFARRVFEDIYSEVSKQDAENAQKPKVEKSTSAEQSTAQGKSSSMWAHWTEQIRPKAKTEEAKKTASTASSTAAPPPTAEVDLGENKSNLHLENSFSGKIFGWFRQQIDDEQTIKMPASHLFRGARIRLQIRRGLSEDLSTVEIVLPADFVVGKPIRLRGLGKKVGKWQGDLYLTLETK